MKKILVAQIAGIGADLNGLMLDTLQTLIDDNPYAKIYHLSCDNTFNVCHANFPSRPALCFRCKTAIENGLKFIQGNFITLSIKDLINEQDLKVAEDFLDHNMTINKDLIYKNYKVGESSISTYITASRDRDLHNVNESETSKFINNGIIFYHALDRFFFEEKIDVVYSYNGRHTYQRAVMSIAEKYGVDCMNMEFARKGGYIECFKNILPQNIKGKQKIVNDIWRQSEFNDEDKLKIAESFFEKKVKGSEINGKSFTKSQIKNNLPPEIDYTKRNFVLFTSSDDEFAAVGEEYDNPYFKDQNEGIYFVAELFQKDELLDCNLIVRMHPNLKGVEHEFANKLRNLAGLYSNVFLILPESNYDSYAFMRIAEKIIAFGSTIAVESCYWGKPVILLGKGFYSGMGIAYEPDSKNQISTLIKGNLMPKDKSPSIRLGYYFLAGGKKAKYFSNNSNGETLFKNHKLNQFSFSEKIKSKVIETAYNNFNIRLFIK